MTISMCFAHVWRMFLCWNDPPMSIKLRLFVCGGKIEAPVPRRACGASLAFVQTGRRKLLLLLESNIVLCLVHYCCPRVVSF